jgi:predicted pyridoxine 5'-phosphate oxidase superfamily flavin-nucleotide-binding protein
MEFRKHCLAIVHVVRCQRRTDVYPNRRRIKIWGTAEIVEDDSRLLQTLYDADYEGRPERAVLFHIKAWDVNCPQHILPRWWEAESAPVVESLRSRIVELERENQQLRDLATVDAGSGTPIR